MEIWCSRIKAWPSKDTFSFRFKTISKRKILNFITYWISDELKPIAAEERRVEEEEKKIRVEKERIAKELAEGLFIWPGILTFHI